MDILGTGEKIIQPSEFQVVNTQRKSIYASKNIKVGSIISKKNVTIKGPAGGLAPKYLDLIIGKKVIKKLFKMITNQPRKFIKVSDLKTDQYRSISDYISGMTDRFAIQLYKSSI